MGRKRLDRRQFLQAGGAALAAGTVFAQQQPNFPSSPSVGPYGARSRFETYGRVTLGVGGARLTPLREQPGIITPAALHYYVNHTADYPMIDPKQHRLMIHGMVDRPVTLTVEELKRLPSVSRIYFIECATNTSPSSSPDAETLEERFGRTSCSEWTGVPLSLLLRETGVQEKAAWLVAEGADSAKFTMSISLDKAMDDALVAYAQNGEPIRPENGYPLRLIVPGWEGVRNVKWLRRIKVADQPFMTRMETASHASMHITDGKSRWFEVEIGPKSVITHPAGGQQLSGPGFHEITGLAWSGWGSVRQVDVSTDGGRTWREAKLNEPVLRLAYAKFSLDWTWNGEDAVIQSRCTDEHGNVQPSVTELTKLWEFPDSTYFRKVTTYVSLFNAIQPWRISRDGSVHNAVWS